MSHAKRLAVGLVALICWHVLPATVWATDPPNILLIVADDQGYNDLGRLGNGIITPHLDRIAREGTRLTDFYVSWSACTPSRASLLTGRYPQRNGISDMIRNEAPDYGHKYSPAQYAVTFERIGGMDTREITIANLLSDADHRCGIFGKWDLGSLKRFLPTSRGFDDFYGFVNTGIDYYTHERYGVPSMFRGLSPTEVDRGVYCTKLFEREAIRFLKEQPVEQPFFLYVPFNAPHSSSSLEPRIRSTIQAPDRYKEMYPSVKVETRRTNNYRYGNPATVTTSEARQRDYRAAVTCMDESIGKLLGCLEDRDQLDETIVIFLSDNGGGGGADNSPLRGKKSTLWEGGVRVPCLIRWPGGNVPADAVNDQLLTSLEVFPSLLSAAGITAPEGLQLDGFSWWPVLKGEIESPRTTMFWKRADRRAARVGSWKWVDMPGKGGGLFDLRDDIGEQRDLSGERPSVLRRVQEAYAKWEAEMEAVEPRGPFRDF
ncbi:MAG: sulfatase-like hydrolase/transferase [Planctomycetota bacterium]